MARIISVSTVTKSFRPHTEGNRDAKKDCDQVCQRVLGRLRHRVKDAAFPDQISKHQETYEGHRLGRHEPTTMVTMIGKRIRMVFVTEPGWYSI